MSPFFRVYLVAVCGREAVENEAFIGQSQKASKKVFFLAPSWEHSHGERKSQWENFFLVYTGKRLVCAMQI